MPAGVDVVVEDGFATIEFVDRSLRGPGLAKLLEVGTPPELIEKVTLPRLAYIVPEGNARLAGLLDEADVPEFADGGVIHGPSQPSEDSVPVLLDPGYVVPGDGIGAQPGETVELVSTDTGGPYTVLPEIENPDGTTPLEPITVEPQPKAWPDGEPDDAWKRPELDAYARSKGIDPTELPNKDAVLAAIEAKVAEQ
ncbi:hypothetical protein HGK72_26945 [Mycolicibacterium fortuitum]|uniref:hypothetical protein n=1 Tax=Mycolicibacterium fortuitum TaxID=1766 RepID=UPI001490739F|nr:hypothetical protein [Mycolicibacterium fortuitum]